MQEAALAEARASFDVAREAVEEMKRAETGSAFAAPWAVFLTAAGRAYAALARGAVGCAASEAWRAAQDACRRSDPLLAYLEAAAQARGRGLGPPSDAPLRGPGGQPLIWGDGDHLAGLEPDPWPFAGRCPAGLVTAPAEGGQREPPAAHLGRALLLTDPVNVALLALAWLEARIAEAADLPRRR